MLLEGLHIPLTTPFHSDGRLNLPKLAANVARYSKTPAAGLIILSPSGEPTLLSDEETREVLSTAASAAAPEKVLIAGISRDSVWATLDLAQYAAEQNYDAVLAGVPAVFTSRGIAEEYSEGRLRELLTYFQTVADRSPLPVILCSDDGGVLHASNIVELAAHANVLGLLTRDNSIAMAEILARTTSIEREVTVTLVFAAVTRRMKKVASYASSPLVSASTLTGKSAAAVAEPPVLSTLRTRTKTVGFQVLAGSATSLLEALRYGASGTAPAFAACAPQACYEVFAAWKDDDQPLAEEKQARLRAAAQLADGFGPGGLKFACDFNGYFGGLPRLPHLPPTGEQRAALQHLLAGIRN